MHSGFGQFRQGCGLVARRLWGLLLPPNCPGCMALLPASEPMGFCAECHGRMPWWNRAQMLAPDLPPAVASFIAPCLYEEPLRQAILQVKFHDGVPFVPALAKLLEPYVPRDIEGLLMVPVPSHRSRLRERRYNHAALIVQRLARRTRVRCDVTGLRRVKAETPQASKTRAARLKLSSGDFYANPRVFKGKEVLLVDDIYTTGATAKACALALRKAGAVRVHVITLAYTPPE